MTEEDNSCSSRRPSSVIVCLDDVEREAAKVLGGNSLDFYRSGSDEEVTLRDNVRAFRRLVRNKLSTCSVHTMQRI